MQEEPAIKSEPEDVEMNPIMAEVQASVTGKEGKKEKPRRYWTPEEEQRLFECWGRDNWRLTKHGKNTRFFAQWSEELKEKFNLEIKPEEIQAKVNTTRAKFRSVKKNPKFDKYNPTWKKFDLIDRLLKNKYRPKDADPIPADASRENRDISSNSEGEEENAEPSREPPATPNSLTSNSQDTMQQQQQHQQAGVQGVIMSTDQINNSTLTDHDVSVNLFNANELQPNPDYGNQLYNDIKQEFVQDYSQQTAYSTQYTNDQNHFTPGLPDEQPQLLELQTPQQQQLHHQQQLQTPQQYNNIIATSSAYDIHSVPNNAAAYTASTPDAMNLYNNQQQPQQQQHYSTTTMAPSTPMQPTYNNVVQPYVNNGNVNVNNTNNIINHSNNNNNNNTNNNNGNGIMQPPPPSTASSSMPRKRGRQPGYMTNHTHMIEKKTSVEPSLESMYLDEVRKKNAILEEQKEISRKRLQVEERQVQLMESFFPKCLEMQTKILDKLLFNTQTADESIAINTSPDNNLEIKPGTPPSQ